MVTVVDKVAVPVLLLAAAAVAAEPAAFAEKRDGREVMARVKASQEPNDEYVEMTMELRRSKGSARKRSLKIWTRRGDDERWLLVRFTSPASLRGTGFLAREPDEGDDERWLYLPSLRRSRRVPASDRNDSFMGSEFSYEDMEALDLDDWRYRVESRDGDQTVIDALPRSESVSSYSRIVYEIDTERSLIARATYYDQDGRKAKQLEGSGAKQHGDVWRHSKLVMRDLRSGRSTILEYDEVRINEGVKESVFDRHNLERGR